MKIRLTVVAEFEPKPEHYDQFTPGKVLETERANLNDMGIDYYLNIFDEDEIDANLQIVEV